MNFVFASVAEGRVKLLVATTPAVMEPPYRNTVEHSQLRFYLLTQSLLVSCTIGHNRSGVFPFPCVTPDAYLSQSNIIANVLR